MQGITSILRCRCGCGLKKLALIKRELKSTGMLEPLWVRDCSPVLLLLFPLSPRLWRVLQDVAQAPERRPAHPAGTVQAADFSLLLLVGTWERQENVILAN